MSERAEPFVRTSRSKAPVPAISLVAAVVDFVRWRSSAGDTRQMLRDEILRIVQAVWPKAGTYIGGTHFRILLDERSSNDGGESVYVDWEGEAAE